MNGRKTNQGDVSLPTWMSVRRREAAAIASNRSQHLVGYGLMAILIIATLSAGFAPMSGKEILAKLAFIPELTGHDFWYRLLTATLVQRNYPQLILVVSGVACARLGLKGLPSYVSGAFLACSFFAGSAMSFLVDVVHQTSRMGAGGGVAAICSVGAIALLREVAAKTRASKSSLLLRSTGYFSLGILLAWLSSTFEVVATGLVSGAAFYAARLPLGWRPFVSTGAAGTFISETEILPLLDKGPPKNDREKLELAMVFRKTLSCRFLDDKRFFANSHNIKFDSHDERGTAMMAELTKSRDPQVREIALRELAYDDFMESELSFGIIRYGHVDVILEEERSKGDLNVRRAEIIRSLDVKVRPGVTTIPAKERFMFGVDEIKTKFHPQEWQVMEAGKDLAWQTIESSSYKHPMPGYSDLECFKLGIGFLYWSFKSSGGMSLACAASLARDGYRDEAFTIILLPALKLNPSRMLRLHHAMWGYKIGNFRDREGLLKLALSLAQKVDDKKFASIRNEITYYASETTRDIEGHLASYNPNNILESVLAEVRRSKQTNEDGYTDAEMRGIQEAAEKGDAESQYRLAHIYLKEQWQQSSHSDNQYSREAAERLLESSASLGYAQAQFELWQRLSEAAASKQKGKTDRKIEGIEISLWLFKAAAGGHTIAIYELGKKTLSEAKAANDSERFRQGMRYLQEAFRRKIHKAGLLVAEALKDPLSQNENSLLPLLWERSAGMMARIENHSSDSEDWTDIGLRVGAAAERGEGVAKNIEEAAWWYANAFMSSTSRQSVILSRGIGDRLASLIEAGTVARTPKFVWPPALEDTRTSTDPASSADSAEEISSAPGAPGAPAGSPLSRIGVDPGRGDSDGSGTESDGSKSAGSAAILKRLSLD